MAISSESISTAFSPDAGAEDLVIKAIDSAHKSIRLAAYSFTSKPVIEALYRAKKRSVDIQCVIDDSNAKNKSGQAAANILINSGIPVRVDSQHSIFHDKFIVIDGKTVETGSFNFSKAAAHSNAENVIVVWADEALASKYSENWREHWGHSVVWRLTY